MPYRTDIPGQVSEAQLKAIEAVAGLVPKNGRVVEVGSLFGRSSHAWASSVDPSVTVFCIDPWEGNEGVRAMERAYGITYGLEQFVEYTGDCPNVVPLQGYSPRDFQDWKEPIDLYYEDAVHTDPVLSRNLAFWSKHLKPTGIICGDDYRPRFPDVRAGAERLAESLGRELLIVDFFWCLLPPERDVPGSDAVAAELRELGAAHLTARRAEGPRFQIGANAVPAPVSELQNVVRGRVSNEGINPWPMKSGSGETTILAALFSIGETPREVWRTTVTSPAETLEPDIPHEFELALPVDGLRRGRYRLVFDLLQPDGSTLIRSDLSRAGGVEVELDTPVVTDHPADDPRNRFVIDVVPADRKWILERLATEIAQAASQLAADFSVSVLDRPSGEADLTYFLPYSVQKPVAGSLVGSWFTHREAQGEAARNFVERAREADFGATPAKRYQKLLLEEGASDVSVIYHGVDLDVYRPLLRIGVVGRTYHTGRKGEDLFARLLDLDGVEFVFAGDGWPLPPTRGGGKDLSAFYQSIDYLLIPSRIEGGPVPLFEALAAGCEVIAADVGCVDDFPHIPFENGDAESLREVVVRLRDAKWKLRESVQDLSWERFGIEHLRLFAQQIVTREPLNYTERASYRPPTAEGQAAPGAALPSLRLISHGTERANKGGPTTRMALLAEAYAERGGDARLTHVTDDESPAEPGAIAHVFNSWPLATSVRAVEAAAVSGARVVFSPIVLDLSIHPYFEHVVMDVLRTSASAEELETRFGLLRLLTEPWDRQQRPVQGVPGHFASITRAVSASDAVVFLSEFERDLVHAMGGEPRREKVIRNGIETAVFAKGDPAPFRSRFRLRDYILIVGRIETRKNQAAVAHALRDLDVPVVAIGGVGNPAYLEQTKQWAGENFVYIDRIDDREMLASAYKGARCLVLASWAEGAPLVALEAGAAGTPLILSEMAAEREYFGEWARYVHPADLEGIRNAVTAEIADPEPASRRQERSEHCCQRYDLAAHVEQTVALYQELAEAPAGELRRERLPEIIDITHWAHDLWNQKHLTGVTSVEQALVDVALQEQPATVYVLWNSPNRAYVRAPTERVADGSFYKLANCKELPPNEQDGPVTYEAVTTFPEENELKARAKQRVKDLARGAIMSAPEPLRGPLLAEAKRLKAGLREAGSAAGKGRALARGLAAPLKNRDLRSALLGTARSGMREASKPPSEGRLSAMASRAGSGARSALEGLARQALDSAPEPLRSSLKDSALRLKRDLNESDSAVTWGRALARELTESATNPEVRSTLAEIGKAGLREARASVSPASVAQALKKSRAAKRVGGPRISYAAIRSVLPRVKGHRLFVFGQPWISNDRQLDDLLGFARANRLQLHCLIHDILYVTDASSFAHHTRETYRRRLLKLLGASHTALVTSQQVESDLRKFLDVHGLSCRVRRFRMGIPDWSELDRGNDSDSGAQTEAGRDHVLYVSSFNQRKNHDFLISAWKDLRTHLKKHGHRQPIPTLVLAGTPQRGYERFGDPAYHEELARHGVRVVNNASDAEIRELFASCLFSVYPSRSEGWGLPPIESLLAGRVCIVSVTVPSASEIRSPGLIRIPADDHFAWLKTMVSFIESPSMRRAFEDAISLDDEARWTDSLTEILAENLGGRA